MRRALAYLPVVLLAGCAQAERPVDPHPYAVPTYLPCKAASDVPARPAWPDNYASMHGVLPNGAVIQIGVDGQVEILIEGIVARDKYIIILETALNGCKK